jgi:glucose-1-phosphate cytidylyltransferase
MMLTVILAGGKGTRMGGGMPKPLVKVENRPLVEHVMDIYTSQGFSSFLLLGGYRATFLMEEVEARTPHWAKVIDTGVDTQTGGRLARARGQGYLQERFFLTYSDGLADVNLKALIDQHERLRRRADVAVTLTAVNPANRFGKVRVQDGIVTEFSEKMADECGWVNGGFYVVEPEIIDLVPGDACVFERDILPLLAAQGRVGAFQHPGDFLCVDTPRDLQLAKDLCRRKERFWLRWKG